MPRYAVRLLQPDAVPIRREIDAPDRAALAAALGVAPQQLLEVVELRPSRRRLAVRPRAFPLQLFSQQLAVLLDAGIALPEALQTLSDKESSGDARATLDAVLVAIRQGQPLSQALRAQPQAFDELVCAIVAANERTGQLSSALAQHARYLAWVQELRSRLLAACVYPAVLLAVGSTVILFLLLYVLPRFAGILDGLDHELPWASRVLIGFGQLAGEHPAWVAALLAALGTGLLAIWRSRALRERLRAMAWQLPLLGPRLRVLALARLYRCLSMLLAAGVPALAALRIAQPLLPGPWRAAVAAAADRVERGERLSDALDAQALATHVASRMLRVGERSGELAAMLDKAAAFHDDELVRLTELLTRAINPVLMLIMGLLIGGIVVLMYLPIFQLVEQVQ